MAFLERIERLLGNLLEGGFGRIFRAEVRPMEIARRLVKEMDANRTTSLARTYAPNEFLVWLSPADRARYAPVEEDLIAELCAYLLEHARREELTLTSRPIVTFETDTRLHLGEFAIQARLVKFNAQGEPALQSHGEGPLPTAPPAPPAPPSAPQPAAVVTPHPPPGEAAPTKRAAVWVAGQRIELGSQAMVIGRSRACDVVIDDPGVSRRHAEIRPAGEGFEVRDLGSTNGVYLNRSPIERSAPLKDGDRIELGATELRFELR